MENVFQQGTACIHGAAAWKTPCRSKNWSITIPLKKTPLVQSSLERSLQRSSESTAQQQGWEEQDENENSLWAPTGSSSSSNFTLERRHLFSNFKKNLFFVVLSACFKTCYLSAFYLKVTYRAQQSFAQNYTSRERGKEWEKGGKGTGLDPYTCTACLSMLLLLLKSVLQSLETQKKFTTSSVKLVEWKVLDRGSERAETRNSSWQRRSPWRLFYSTKATF